MSSRFDLDDEHNLHDDDVMSTVMFIFSKYYCNSASSAFEWNLIFQSGKLHSKKTCVFSELRSLTMADITTA